MSTRTEGLKALGIGLGLLLLCGVAALLFTTFTDFQSDNLWDIIFRFFFPIAIMFGAILALLILWFSLVQLITGKGDVMGRLNQMFEDSPKVTEGTSESAEGSTKPTDSPGPD